MSRIYLPLILILLIILQGVPSEIIGQHLTDADLIITVHAVFIFLVLFKTFYDPENSYNAVVFAVFSGLTIDIIYTDVIGVYMFSYAAMVYFVHGMSKFIYINFYTSTVLAISSIGFLDLFLYYIYQFIGITEMDISRYLYNRLIPTIIINSVIFLIFYLIFKKKLVRWSTDRYDQEGSTN